MLHSNRDWLSSLKTHVRQDVWNIDRFAECARCWSFANYLSQTQIQTNENLVYLVKRNILHLLSRIAVHNFHTNKTWGSLRKSQYQPACCHTIWKKKTTIIDQWIYQLTLLSAAIRTAAFANLRKGLSTGEIATAMLCIAGSCTTINPCELRNWQLVDWCGLIEQYIVPKKWCHHRKSLDPVTPLQQFVETFADFISVRFTCSS